MNGYERFCFNLIGRCLKKKRGDYNNLQRDLLRARINRPLEYYLATTYASTGIVGLTTAILAGLAAYLFQIPDMVTYHGDLPEIFYALSGHKLVIGSIAIAILSSLILGSISYLMFLLYPKLRAGERRREIEFTLPYAINYMTTMSAAGITPDKIFRMLGQSQIYGESAVEASYVSRETDFFGRDLLEALRIVSQTTPSKRMQEFLQGTLASISSGSDLTVYLRTKAHQYTLENNQQQKTFIETLNLIAESYVTVMVAGMLFLIILQSMMAILSGDQEPLFLYAIIYLIVPLGSIMVLILVSSISPEGWM